MTELPVIAQAHLIVGTISVASGFAAVLIRKGSTAHTWVGRTFVTTMTLLCLSGFYLSYTRSLQLTWFLAFFSLYLLLTGWYAMSRDSTRINFIDKAGFAFVSSASLFAFAVASFGVLCDLPHPPNEPPYAGYYVFAFFGAFVSYWDFKVLRSQTLAGMPRVVRHLWRMIFSLFIATFIFFTGNTHVLPEYLRHSVILATPILAVIVALVFWLVYVKRKNGFR